jgi:3-oxoacyl-[acyl-carrier protein] reductase
VKQYRYYSLSRDKWKWAAGANSIPRRLEPCTPADYKNRLLPLEPANIERSARPIRQTSPKKGIPTSRELSGKIAVVTGASSGIGRAIALELAAAGCGVLVHARRCAAAHDTAQQIQALGCPASVSLFDLSEPDAHDALAEQAWNWQQGVDIWVNNAGADVLTGELARQSFEQKLAALWKIDVLACIRLTRNVGGRMKARGHGVIINIGWDQATQGMEGDSGQAFAATKAAVMAFTKSAALSLAPEVRVNCIAPGWIKTAWADQASEAWQRRALRECQLGRWGTPEDVARVARFLASPESSFIDAQVIHVNGGFRPR